MAHKIKTEHAGAKKGGSGFYGHHAEAKKVCKVKRRIADKKEILLGIKSTKEVCVHVEPTSFVAIPFGNDGFSGDSPFYPTDQEDDSAGPIPAALRSTFKRLKKEYYERCQTCSGLDFGDIHEPSGFWILTPENLELAMLPSSVSEPWSIDGECCLVNSITKRMCHRLATRVVGDKSVLEG